MILVIPGLLLGLWAQMRVSSAFRKYSAVHARSGMSAEDVGSWRLDAALMSKANPDVRLLLSASPVEAIPVDQKILSSPASWLVRQAEYRLRVHKRILHWVFLDNESPA